MRAENHLSVSYLAEAFDHYSAADLRHVLGRESLNWLLRKYGYDVLYRTWLDAQIKRDIAVKQYELVHGIEPGEKDKVDIRGRIVQMLNQDLEIILRRQRQLLYGAKADA